MAHELRNPLAPIRTGLEIIKRDSLNGPASTRARDTMERQLAHMIRLIDDLLDISRINSGKIRLEPSRTRLAAAVESAVEISRPLIESRGHQLQVELPRRGIELMADATRLAQTLGNLLNNAAKYTPPEGHLRLKAWQDGAMAVIEVADDGVGIPPDMLEQVFSLFTQVGRTLDRAQGGPGIAGGARVRPGCHPVGHRPARHVRLRGGPAVAPEPLGADRGDRIGQRRGPAPLARGGFRRAPDQARRPWNARSAAAPPCR